MLSFSNFPLVLFFQTDWTRLVHRPGGIAESTQIAIRRAGSYQYQLEAQASVCRAGAVRVRMTHSLARRAGILCG